MPEVRENPCGGKKAGEQVKRGAGMGNAGDDVQDP